MDLRIPRLIAAIILAVEGLMILSVSAYFVPVMSQYLESTLEVWSVIVLSIAVHGIAAYQIFRDKPGIIAWMDSTVSALVFTGWFRVLGAFPLLYLLLRIFMKRPAKAPTSEGASASPSTPATEETSGAETVVIVLALAAQGLLWSLIPSLGIKNPDNNYLPGFAGFLIAMTLGILVHELGHATAGHFMGFRMIRFASFPFEYVNLSQRWYLKWNFTLAGHYAGVPSHLQNLQRRHVFMTACGPLASLLFALVCWGVLFLANGSIGGLPFSILKNSVSFGLVTSILNLIPFKLRGQKTDGRFLWDAAFDRTAAEATVAALSCASSLRSTLRPRDWPEEWLAYLRSNSSDISFVVLLSCSAEDRLLLNPLDITAHEDLVTSAQRLSALTPKVPEQMRHVFTFHRAWLGSRYLGEFPSVDFAAAKADKDTEDWEICRMRAALMASHGNFAPALELLDEAAAMLTNPENLGIRALDADTISAFRRELLTRQTEAALEAPPPLPQLIEAS